jgi:hypothetical protein
MGCYVQLTKIRVRRYARGACTIHVQLPFGAHDACHSRLGAAYS